MCEGCAWEWSAACKYVREGFHLATTCEWEFSMPVRSDRAKKHFYFFVVNDDGEWVAG